MSPTPSKQPMVPCPACGTLNDPSRGSTQCRDCKAPLAALARFEFPATGQPVRTLLRDGEPWFVAADVCAVLSIGRTHDAVRGLDDDEKGAETVRTPGGDQLVSVVNEPGLYSLTFRSRKPEAKAFRRWIAHEVLPAIRRTGSYSVAPRFEVPQSFAEALELAARQARQLEAAEQKVAELEPEAARAQRTMNADGLALVGTVAKRFGIKERALREFLFAEKLLIRDGSRRNEPYARHIETGHFELKTRLVDVHPDRAPEERSTTFVTPKGEALIWRRLYAAGLVASPTMPGMQLALVEGGA